MLFRNLYSYLKYILKGIRNFFTISGAVFFSRMLSGIALIITAKILGGERYALFSAGFFAMSIIGFGTNGMDKTFVYQFVKNESNKQGEFFSSFVTVKIFIHLVTVLLSLIFLHFLKVFLGELLQPVFYGIIISVSFLILSFVSTVFQSKQLFKSYSLVILTFDLFVFLWSLAGAFFLHNTSVYYYLLAYIIGGISILPFVKGIDRNFFFNFNQAKKFFFLSKWLFLAELIWLFFIRLDYFTISKILLRETLGNYALALRLVNVFFIFVASMAIMVLPKAAEIKSKKQLFNFWKINLIISFFLLLINIFSMIFAGKVICMVFGPQYTKSIVFFRWMLIAYLPTIFFPPFQYLLLTFKKEFFYFLFHVILILSYLILFKPLIALMGANGIITAKGLSFSFSLLFAILIYFKSKRLIV